MVNSFTASQYQNLLASISVLGGSNQPNQNVGHREQHPSGNHAPTTISDVSQRLKLELQQQNIELQLKELCQAQLQEQVRQQLLRTNVPVQTSMNAALQLEAAGQQQELEPSKYLRWIQQTKQTCQPLRSGFGDGGLEGRISCGISKLNTGILSGRNSSSSGLAHSEVADRSSSFQASKDCCQASRKRRKRPRTGSKYFGVHYDPDTRMYVASLNKDNSTECIGYYRTEVLAALAVDTRAEEIFGSNYHSFNFSDAVERGYMISALATNVEEKKNALSVDVECDDTKANGDNDVDKDDESSVDVAENDGEQAAESCEKPANIVDESDVEDRDNDKSRNTLICEKVSKWKNEGIMNAAETTC